MCNKILYYVCPHSLQAVSAHVTKFTLKMVSENGKSKHRTNIYAVYCSLAFGRIICSVMRSDPGRLIGAFMCILNNCYPA